MRNLAAASLLFLSAGAYADSVTLYGITDASVEYVKGTTSAVRLADGDMSASRFGLTGTESLSSDTKIVFRLEAGFNINNGTEFFGNNTIFGRQAYVGIKSFWGELRMGRQFTPAFYALARLDPFGLNASMSPFVLLAKSSAQGGEYVPYGSRFSNALEYWTPNFRGFSSTIAIAPGGVAGDLRSGTGMGANIMYDRAPFYAFYAFQSAYNAVGPTNPEADLTLNHYIGLAYDIGPVELGALFGVSMSRGSGTHSSKDAGITASWKLNPQDVLMAALIKRIVSGEEERPLAVTIGWDHSISKRTSIYVRGLAITNSPGGSDTLDNIPIASGSGDTGYSFAVGIDHRF